MTSSIRRPTRAPAAIARLVLRRDDDAVRLPRALVTTQAAEDLVAVALGHDDVEQHDVGPLRGDLVLEVLAVDVREHLVPGGPQDRLHHLELGVRVVHDHHLAHAELKPPLGTRPRPCETEGGCATDLPSRLAVRRWRYFKENATAARLHGPKSLRRSRSSLESRDNFARSPDTLACEALNDACPTARTLDFRSPRSLAGILNAPVTYGLQAIPERGGRGAAATRSEEHTSELQSRSDLVCRLLLEKKTS